jgi:hypothetical protein
MRGDEGKYAYARLNAEGEVSGCLTLGPSLGAGAGTVEPSCVRPRLAGRGHEHILESKLVNVAETLKDFGFDRYDRTARLSPALLAAWPALALLLLWAPKVIDTLGAILSLALWCGLLYALASFARYQGRSVQRTLWASRGGNPSMIALRHRDHTIRPRRKEALHRLLNERLAARGVVMPTAEEEAADPSSADDVYGLAHAHMLEATRSDRLLLNENIQYGFRRNLLGLRPWAMGLAAVALLADLTLTVRYGASGDDVFGGAVLAGGFALALAAWGFTVDQAFLDDASDAYTTRLFIAYENLEGEAPPNARKISSPTRRS